MTDADLVRQVRAGQTDAFAELARRWAGRVTALCHARTRNAHLADDLTQEALLRRIALWGALLILNVSAPGSVASRCAFGSIGPGRGRTSRYFLARLAPTMIPVIGQVEMSRTKPNATTIVAN